VDFPKLRSDDMPATDWMLPTQASGTGWANPTRILSDVDGLSSEAYIGAQAASGDLLALAPDLSAIPAGATPEGIEVQVRGNRWPYPIAITSIRIRKAGANVGSNLASPAVYLNASAATLTFGGPTALWGASFTRAELLTGFGLALQVYNPDEEFSSSGLVDWVKFRIHYAAAVVAAARRRMWHAHRVGV
jgi:hypothetical protein